MLYILSLSMMSMVAVEAKTLTLSSAALIRPKNRSVPSTKLSSVIGTLIVVSNSPAGKMIGMAFADAVSVKSTIAIKVINVIRLHKIYKENII